MGRDLESISRGRGRIGALADTRSLPSQTHLRRLDLSKTRHDFAHDVLLKVAGASGNDHLGGLWALQGWMVAESGSEPCDGKNGARYNPLNTTLKMTGSTNFNSVGVQNYTSYAEGLAATAATFNEASFAKIVDQLHIPDMGVPELAAKLILWEVVGSPWGTSGRDAYNGLETFLVDRSRYNQLTLGG